MVAAVVTFQNIGMMRDKSPVRIIQRGNDVFATGNTRVMIAIMQTIGAMRYARFPRLSVIFPRMIPATPPASARYPLNVPYESGVLRNVSV